MSGTIYKTDQQMRPRLKRFVNFISMTLNNLKVYFWIINTFIWCPEPKTIYLPSYKNPHEFYHWLKFASEKDDNENFRFNALQGAIYTAKKISI